MNWIQLCSEEFNSTSLNKLAQLIHEMLLWNSIQRKFKIIKENKEFENKNFETTHAKFKA